MSSAFYLCGEDKGKDVRDFVLFSYFLKRSWIASSKSSVTVRSFSRARYFN